MWRSKKSVLIAALAAVILVGSGAAVALAQTGTPSQTSGKTIFARVATILGIDQKKLEDAFAQAQREMQNEALDNYLKDMVAQGRITQQQADQYKQWWLSRPNVPVGPGGPRGGHIGPGRPPGPMGPGPWGPMGKIGPQALPPAPTPTTN